MNRTVFVRRIRCYDVFSGPQFNAAYLFERVRVVNLLDKCTI